MCNDSTRGGDRELTYDLHVLHVGWYIFILTPHGGGTLFGKSHIDVASLYTVPEGQSNR